jgi:hypothetical protein
LEDPKLLTAVSENHIDLGIKSVTLYYVIDFNQIAGKGLAKIMELNKASEIGWFKIANPPSPLFPKLDEVLKLK